MTDGLIELSREWREMLERIQRKQAAMNGSELCHEDLTMIDLGAVSTLTIVPNLWTLAENPPCEQQPETTLATCLVQTVTNRTD